MNNIRNKNPTLNPTKVLLVIAAVALFSGAITWSMNAVMAKALFAVGVAALWWVILVYRR